MVRRLSSDLPSSIQEQSVTVGICGRPALRWSERLVAAERSVEQPRAAQGEVDDSVVDLAESFVLSRPTVYRTPQRLPARSRLE